MKRTRAFAVAGLLLAFVAFIVLQIWATRAMVVTSRASLDGLQHRLSALDPAKLSQAKIAEEIITLRVENDRKAVFLSTLVANLNAALAVLVTLIGAGIGFYQYLALRSRERNDRAASELTDLWKGITADDPRVRAGSVAGLQEFLREDRADFHSRVVSALALVGRFASSNDSVLTTYSRVVEIAMKVIRPETRRSVSWQGISLSKANLRHLDLSCFDLRDSSLESCDFTGSDLSNANFEAARLGWAKFNGATLTGAYLRYADLVGADLTAANLQGANLRHAKILGANLQGADLTGASFRLDSLDWTLTRNWRGAKLDPPLGEKLLARYGPELSGIRILMLVWEYPPFISGGGWTAVFHLLRSLRLIGANVTVLVPWGQEAISRAELGYEYNLLCAGIDSAADISREALNYGSYGTYSTYRNVEQSSKTDAPPSLSNMVTEYELRSMDMLTESDTEFDLLHAHDWLTFGAARRIAASFSLPWIAHFHSCEFERRSKNPSPSIERSEREACSSAQRVVTVGTELKKLLVGRYGAKDGAVEVLPNCFKISEAQVDHLGSFHAQRVVYVGRVNEQKGPDHFVQIAAEIRKLRPRAQFAMFGTGDIEQRVAAQINELGGHAMAFRVPNDWSAKYLFETVEQVGVDPETGEWLRIGELPTSDGYAMAQMLQGVALKVRPVQLAYPYTHLITVPKQAVAKGVLGNIGEIHYLIRTAQLPSYGALPNPFVVMHGAVPWHRRREAFYGASAVIVPSRFEPFGFVVLEAMQYGVPVFYPQSAGIAEVISSGVRTEPADHGAVAQVVHDLLSDERAWERIRDEQIAELCAYPSNSYAQRLQRLWQNTGAMDTTSPQTTAR